MYSLFKLLYTILDIYMWIIIIHVVLSWLVAFNIVNSYNDIIRLLRETLFRLTEPLLGPIRRLVPLGGGIDISPIILILLIYFVQMLIVEYVFLF